MKRSHCRSSSIRWMPQIGSASPKSSMNAIAARAFVMSPPASAFIAMKPTFFSRQSAASARSFSEER